jgi:hypothetical protein
MKFIKKKVSLFPENLTKHWESAAHRRYSSMNDDDVCPWNLSPKTIDEFVLACDKRNEWHKSNAGDPRYSWWSCILTHDLMEDIARTLKEVKDAQRNT